MSPSARLVSRTALRNLREVPEFVANIVTMHLLERMNFTSGDFPHEEDEFDWACLTPAGFRPRPGRPDKGSTAAGGSSFVGRLSLLVNVGSLRIYRTVCQSCHMAAAQGAVGAGAYPALANDPKLAVA